MFELYGMTEVTAISHANAPYPGGTKLGTVGKVSVESDSEKMC